MNANDASDQPIVHTPGPWRQFAQNIEDENDPDYRSISAGSGLFLHRTGFEITGFISEADARLIAAAPELLEACRLVLDAIEQANLRGEVLWIHRNSAVHESASERLQHVIERATGGTVV